MTYTRRLDGSQRTESNCWCWREYGITRHWFIGGSRWGVWFHGDLLMMIEDGRAMVRALLEREGAK
jgi:hypothetical protein